jgi:hypothetical protein
VNIFTSPILAGGKRGKGIGENPFVAPSLNKGS